MTASAHTRRPVWQALWPASPRRAVWALPLLGLLFLLPFGGSAHASDGVPRGTGPSAVRSAHAAPAAAPDRMPAHAGPHGGGHGGFHGRTAPAPRDGLPTLCSAYGDGGSQGNGCSGGRHCLQDAVLPNAPPQPAVTAPSHPVVPGPAPAAEPRGPLPGSHRAPDLHLLQVLLT